MTGKCSLLISYNVIRGGGREFDLGGGAELIKCFDPNEGDALRRGV